MILSFAISWSLNPSPPFLGLYAVLLGRSDTQRYKRWVKPRPNDRNMPTQHIATLVGATFCVCLGTVLLCVATCWVFLAGAGESSSCQQYQTSRDMFQHVLRLTMLRYVALECCDRLAGALHVKHFYLRSLSVGNFNSSALGTYQ